MNRKILIVEDSALQAKMYRGLLASQRLVFAQNGLEALDQLVVQNDIDLILLDINMPKMNGLTFLETMRRDGWGHIPVIVISTEDREEDIRRALLAGARAYIKKPWQPEQILSLIDRIGRPAGKAAT